MSVKKEAKRKVKQLHIRISEDEYFSIKKKAKKYPSISALILDAVANFDMKRGRNRIDTMIEFSKDMRKAEVDISRIGNNINQIAKELHRYRLEGISLNNAPLASLTKVMEEGVAVLEGLESNLKSIASGKSKQ